MPAPISIIIPTLNSETDLPETLNSLFEGIENNLIRELIISDGGSTDKTKFIANEVGASIVEGYCGRGLQINKGIDKSQGGWILILHADTSLSLDWSVNLMQKINKNFAYHFKLKIKSKSLFARNLEFWAQIRSKFLGLPYGDQGFLIHRDLLGSVGGFPKTPIMEDVALASRLRGKIEPLDILAHTSAEKYQKNGWLRQSIINFSILVRYLIGKDTNLLYKIYYKN
ncbi:TIGR04283 family arsenosugar biosynthesis glycosyltransferase [Paracoccaceae bacterium]|nr:TIGR04283 family arsenosugar biosynthesis glycosyltransferase [Paracoccaceae bacterium]